MKSLLWLRPNVGDRASVLRRQSRLLSPPVADSTHKGMETVSAIEIERIKNTYRCGGRPIGRPPGGDRRARRLGRLSPAARSRGGSLLLAQSHHERQHRLSRRPKRMAPSSAPFSSNGAPRRTRGTAPKSTSCLSTRTRSASASAACSWTELEVDRPRKRLDHAPPRHPRRRHLQRLLPIPRLDHGRHHPPMGRIRLRHPRRHRLLLQAPQTSRHVVVEGVSGV